MISMANAEDNGASVAPQQPPCLWVHSHLAVVLFVHHDQSALSVYCTNHAYTSCYDL
jgi:hypothetical protein